jgi:hypothetical protein
MPLVHFDSVAGELSAAWKSSVVGTVGPARIKVLRMNELAYEEETHDYKVFRTPYCRAAMELSSVSTFDLESRDRGPRAVAV